MAALIQSTCQAHGCEADLDIRLATRVNNHVGMAAAFKAVACEYLGTAHVHDLDIRMTGEDFSYFANEIPGASTGWAPPHRSPETTWDARIAHARFDVDEEALKVGTGLMAYAPPPPRGEVSGRPPT